MLKIGDFSLTGRVSVRTLRHYDDLGLLRPARVDPETGYRFYAIGQLPRLHRILALKELGLSLAEIGRALADGPSPDALRAMLERKRAEVARLVDSEQARLARISARLDQVEREEIMEGYDVLLKSVPAQPVATLREILPDYAAAGRLFEELRGYVFGHNLRAGAWTAVWHCPEFQERDVDGEATVAVAGPLPPHPRIRPGELPAVPTMACLIHHGPYATLTRAYAALGAWLAANGYRTVGPTREVYHHGGPDQHDPAYVTELQFPVAKPSSATPSTAGRAPPPPLDLGADASSPDHPAVPHPVVIPSASRGTEGRARDDGDAGCRSRHRLVATAEGLPTEAPKPAPLPAPPSRLPRSHARERGGEGVVTRIPRTRPACRSRPPAPRSSGRPCRCGRRAGSRGRC